MKKEVEYLLTGERSRGRICMYHGKPAPLKLNKAFPADVAGLKPVSMNQSIKIMGNMEEIESNFTIGYEVEKNQLHRDAIREYELFCGFEEDSSCGYEAVTHVLPLIPASIWRNKVYDMMHKAERIIDDRYSPSNYKCGGHITMTCVGMDGEELLSKIRLNSAIMLSLYRLRLANTFCLHNLTMLPKSSRNDWTSGWHMKYNCAKIQNFPDGTSGVEFRIPSKIESVKQMMRRYELMYEIMNVSVNKPATSYAAFTKIIRPIIISMYGGNEVNADKVIALSKHFHKFILTGKINKEVQPFVDPNMLMRTIYERGVSAYARQRSIDGYTDRHEF